MAISIASPWKTKSAVKADEGFDTTSQESTTGEKSPIQEAYLGGEYPTFQTITFPTIEAAPFNFTDPQEFAKKFGEFNFGNVKKNFEQSQKFALGALDTELRGLKAYAPAAAALKREQISADNLFNQAARTGQINAVLPEARGDLAAQRERARAYAEGRLPDEMLDRSLELGIRSRAADAAGFSGFGAKSAQASKLSDLMSAEQRFQIGQYGESLVTNNLGTKASLFLAPTEYAETGSEISAKPEVGAGRLTYQGLGMINAATLLDPATALSSKISQNEFTTQLEQRTREFNATGQFAADQFNSVGTFEADLGRFNYDAGYEAANVAANQGSMDVASSLLTSGLMQSGANAGMSNGQAASTLQDLSSSIGLIPRAVSGVSDLITGENTLPATQTGTQVAPLNDTKPVQTDTTTPAPVAAKSLDISAPASYKFAQGVEAPVGYTKFASNSDGTYSAANIKDYENELERFAKFSGTPSGSIKVENAAKADRTLSNAAGLSYVPLPNFQPIGTSGSGRPMYSFSPLANSGDTSLGRSTVLNLGTILASLGVSDPAIFRSLGQVNDVVSDPGTIPGLDQLLAEKGQTAVAQALINKLLGRSPDLGTDAGQEMAFMANRLGEVWGSLSPAQKSRALAALGNPAIRILSGKNPADETVPGSENSPAGALRIGDVLSLTSQGINGHALARNWNQLSSIVNMASGTKGVTEIARISKAIGLLGYGPQGSAVPLEPGQLAKVGARAVPSMGVGAAAFKNANDVPKHYKSIARTKDGETIALPVNLLHTTPLGAGGPTPLAYSKAAAVSAGKHPAQKLWGNSPTGKIARGSVGGSALVSGLKTMRNANPTMLGSVIAHSLFNSVHGGD